MTMDQEVQRRTRAFARVLGPFYLIAGIVMAVRAADMRSLLDEFASNDVWPWTTGAFVLVGGIAIIAFHQYWHSAAAALVSVIGWGMAFKGFALLAFPHAYSAFADHLIGATAVWRGGYVLGAVMGVYLTYVGWGARHCPGGNSAATTETADIARAA